MIHHQKTNQDKYSQQRWSLGKAVVPRISASRSRPSGWGVGEGRCGLLTVSIREFYGAGQQPIAADSFLGERRVTVGRMESVCVWQAKETRSFGSPSQGPHQRCSSAPPLWARAAATPVGGAWARLVPDSHPKQQVTFQGQRGQICQADTTNVPRSHYPSWTLVCVVWGLGLMVKFLSMGTFPTHLTRYSNHLKANKSQCQITFHFDIIFFLLFKYFLSF